MCWFYGFLVIVMKFLKNSVKISDNDISRGRGFEVVVSVLGFLVGGKEYNVLKL